MQHLSNKGFMRKTKNAKLYTSKLWTQRKIDEMNRWRSKYAKENMPYTLVEVEVNEIV